MEELDLFGVDGYIFVVGLMAMLAKQLVCIVIPCQALTLNPAIWLGQVR